MLTRGDLQAPDWGQRYNLTITNWARLWHLYPDPEIAIAFFGAVEQLLKQSGTTVFTKSIPESIVPTEGQIDLIEGIEQVVFVGFPNGVWDSVNALPILRSGTTATPFSIDFENKPRFLIDASVFGGSSGSPVIIFDPNFRRVDANNRVMGEGTLYLAGIIGSAYFWENQNEIVERYIPTQQSQVANVREMIDLGIVYKSHLIRDFTDVLLAADKPLAD